MNKRPPAKKPQAKIQTVKKQIPVKKIAPDRIEELVKKHLGNIGEAENAFKSVSALLEKHKTKYPELEQYIEHVSASDRSIQILEDIKDPRRAHYIFKILLTGVQPAYQVAHPGEKDHTSVDRAAWISTFEEALAKAIVQIILSRQAEQASQGVGSPKDRIPTPDHRVWIGRDPGYPRTNNIIRSIIKVTVKHIDPDERMTFAYLNKDEVPVLCSWYEWKEWWKREGDRCQVKYDRIDDWEIETRFQGRSAALDVPPLFWDVRFLSPRIVSDGARHFGTKDLRSRFMQSSSKGSALCTEQVCS